MKVIKKGIPLTELPRQQDCHCCGARLEFTESDGQVHTRFQERVLEIHCPECGTKIEVVTHRAPEEPRYTLDCKTSPLDASQHTLSHTTKGYTDGQGRIQA